MMNQPELLKYVCNSYQLMQIQPEGIFEFNERCVLQKLYQQLEHGSKNKKIDSQICTHITSILFIYYLICLFSYNLNKCILIRNVTC